MLPAALALALSFVLLPGAVDAQEEEPQEQPEAQETCTLEVTPQAVEVGEAAVSITADLSAGIGEVEELEAPEESGLVLASAADLPRTEMAQPEEPEEGAEPQPVEMALEGNSATVWLNTEDATAGTYGITLKGEEGECTGQITIGSHEAPAGERQPPAEQQPPR